MTMSPTINQSTACARPLASWSVSTTPSAMSAAVAYRPWTVDGQMMADTQAFAADHSISDSVFLGHLGSNGTTESKRLNPGPLDEVLT